MKLTGIKKGRWYETKQGVGECLASGGTHPPSARFRIEQPIPRGVVNMAPRDVIREVEAPADETTLPKAASQAPGERAPVFTGSRLEARAFAAGLVEACIPYRMTSHPETDQHCCWIVNVSDERPALLVALGFRLGSQHARGVL